jgi:hypothetical protein
MKLASCLNSKFSLEILKFGLSRASPITSHSISEGPPSISPRKGESPKFRGFGPEFSEKSTCTIMFMNMLGRHEAFRAHACPD